MRIAAVVFACVVVAACGMTVTRPVVPQETRFGGTDTTDVVTDTFATPPPRCGYRGCV